MTPSRSFDSMVVTVVPPSTSRSVAFIDEVRRSLAPSSVLTAW